jgi:hypothetical protein
MRTRVLWLCVAIGLLITVPPAAAKRPPRPIVASHGVRVKAGYVGQCPRRDRDCAIPDVFATTKPVPVHPGGSLRINTKRRVRRLRLDLDCPHHRLKPLNERNWLFKLPDDGCTIGELLLTYRRLEVTYTFSVERHEHCRLADSETIARNDVVRIFSHPVPAEEGPDPSYPGHAFVACRFGSGDALFIGRNQCLDAYYGCDFLEHVALAEEKVAYVTGRYSGRYGPDRYSALRVLDTATWQVEREITMQEGLDGAAKREFTAVALKANGSVAWILDRVDYTGAGNSQTYEVWKSDGAGMVLLDSDPEIDPASLLLDGSTLTWTRAGEPRSATLD